MGSIDSLLKRLDTCENMKWFTDLYEQLKDDSYVDVRVAVAEYSNEFHEQLKDDSDWSVRRAVAEFRTSSTSN